MSYGIENVKLRLCQLFAGEVISACAPAHVFVYIILLQRGNVLHEQSVPSRCLRPERLLESFVRHLSALSLIGVDDDCSVIALDD
jgi:hypothetical protein